MLDTIKNVLHNALPYLSYAVNAMNRILSVIASFLGVEIPGVTTTAPESENESSSDEV